jgi:carboxypeptidase C (cathepsin A)/drug/metabolite transporter (DMT)-like permease
MSFYGVLAACCAPVAQVFGFIIWDEHWKGSPYALNLFKCSFASILFVMVALSIRIAHVSSQTSSMLILSSILGIVIGDCAWLGAMQILGARQVITIDASKPFFAAILGYLILNEPLSYMVAIGLLTSSAGIGIVAYETNVKASKAKPSTAPSRNADEIEIVFNKMQISAECSFEECDIEEEKEVPKVVWQQQLRSMLTRQLQKNRRAIGYILALANVLFDSYGFVLTKQYGRALNTWEINLIRFGFASAMMIAISLAMLIYKYIEQILSSSSSSRNHRAFSTRNIEFSKLSSESSHPSSDTTAGASSTGVSTAADEILDFSEGTTDTTATRKPSIAAEGKDAWFTLPVTAMRREDWLKISIGVVFVTFISTALTNYAVFQLTLGLCVTLTSLGPLISIPFVYVMKKESTNLNAFGGAFLAVLGIIILTYGNDIYFSVQDSESASSTNAAWGAQEVKSLPGWYGGSLPSKQYSGYLNTSMNGMTMHTHYWFVESENMPCDDPLVLWFNGGPGASSVYGHLVEIGPFRLTDLSYVNDSYQQTQIPQLIYNPYGWQKIANLLFISMPAPVGFSYCSPAGPAMTGDACGSWNDSSSADLTYDVIKQWLELYQHYRNHTVYITGESYAGVYIPMIVERILANEHNFPIRLEGFAIGDACTPPAICGLQPSRSRIPWSLRFFYGKSAYSMNLQDEISSTCDAQQYASGDIHASCQSLLDQVTRDVGGYFEYSYFDDCWYENDFSSTSSQRKLRAKPGFTSSLPTYTYRTGLDGYACGSDQAMFEWLSHPSVKAALHVPVDAAFYQVDNAEGFPYYSTEADLLSWYQRIVAEKKLRVLIYNGDTDPGINSFRSQQWVRELGFNESQSWRPWTLDGCQRMGGAVTRYANGLDHLSIRGAGHMVPLFKPEAAFAFISKFLRHEDYLPYDASCSKPPPSSTGQAYHEIELRKQLENKRRALRESKLLEALRQRSSSMP